MKKTILILGIIFMLVGISLNPIIAVFNSNNDTTPPVTTISLNGTMSELGIYTSDIEVTLNATDDISGVNVTYYRLDIGDTMIYREPFIVIGHDWHVLVYWSVDNAGNKEKINIVYIEIDLIPPEITIGWERLDNKSIKFDPLIYEQGSGIYKTDFYIDNNYMYTVYGVEPEWIWTPNSTGRYLASCIVYDKANYSGCDEMYINIPRNKAITNNNLLLRILERFPLLHRLLDTWRNILV